MRSSLRGRAAASFRLALLLTALSAISSGCGIAPFSWFARGRTRPASGEAGALEGDAARAGAAAIALPELERLAASDSTGAYWPFRLGEALAFQGALAEAESALARSLSREPRYEPALSLLSKIQYGTGRHAEAIDLLEGAGVEAGSLSAPLATALALHYEAAGDPARAAQIAASVRESGARWENTGSALTYLGLRGEGFLDCADTARRALEANPASAANHNNYGITLLYGGDPRGAREAFLRALELDPDLPGALYNLAIVERSYFFDEPRARERFSAYRELAAEDPDSLAGLLGLGAEAAPVARRGKTAGPSGEATKEGDANAQ